MDSRAPRAERVKTNNVDQPRALTDSRRRGDIKGSALGWSTRRRLPTRQALLFLLAIVVPCALLVALGLRMIVQERELADKRLSDERRRLASDIRQELLLRLERIKLDVLSARATVGTPERSGEQHRALALVAPVENGRLVLPWDRPAGAEAFAAAIEEPRFAEAVRLGEREELVAKQFDQAVRAYQRALAAARLPAQTAFARLLVARALAKSGRNHDATTEYRKILGAPVGIVDEQGIPIALYAARRVLDARDVGVSDRRTILDVLQAGLHLDPSLPPAALYMVGDVTDRLAAAGEPTVRQAAADLRGLLTVRSRDVERAQALQNAFPSLIPASDPSTKPAGEPIWVPFGSADDLWLVSMSGSIGNTTSVLVAVRAGVVLATLDAARAASSTLHAETPVSVQTRANDEPLGRSFPGLNLAFAGERVASEGNLQRTFYLVALALVLSVALFGGYLFWRDVRREVRLAEMRSQFVSSVSHELKTPLTAIRMFAETLLMGRSADPEIRGEYLETIVNESERLTRLLNNVLDFSKIEQGNKTYRLEPHSLPSVVRSAAKTMQYPLSQQGFELRVEIDEGVPAIAADPDAIEQAILNLLSNAMKYSGQGRTIDLRLTREGNQALIVVIDRGLGISAREQTKIFEKFYRVASRENRHIPGTGLGLTLVDHVARAHGGFVKVTSTPGEGSTFSIVLPLPHVTTDGQEAVTAKPVSLAADTPVLNSKV